MKKARSEAALLFVTTGSVSYPCPHTESADLARMTIVDLFENLRFNVSKICWTISGTQDWQSQSRVPKAPYRACRFNSCSKMLKFQHG